MNKYPILQVTFGYPKFWGDDTGRDTLSGTFSGTFKGVYPTFTIYFGATDQQQIEELTSLFDKPHVTLKYYDHNKKAWVEKGCYTPDYSLDLDTLEIIPSIIKNKHKLTYQDAEEIITSTGLLHDDLILISKIFDKITLKSNSLRVSFKLVLSFKIVKDAKTYGF